MNCIRNTILDRLLICIHGIATQSALWKHHYMIWQLLSHFSLPLYSESFFVAFHIHQLTGNHKFCNYIHCNCHSHNIGVNIISPLVELFILLEKHHNIQQSLLSDTDQPNTKRKKKKTSFTKAMHDNLIPVKPDLLISLTSVLCPRPPPPPPPPPPPSPPPHPPGHQHDSYLYCNLFCLCQGGYRQVTARW